MSRVRVESVPDPASFLERAAPLLLMDEARHNLILGIAGTLLDFPDAYRESHLWLVEDGADVVAAGLVTPPFNLVLAGDPGGAEALAASLARDGVRLPGVTGAVPEAEVFAARWESETGGTTRARMQQRVYRLERLRPPRATRGSARVATEDDRELLVEWIRAFATEVAHDASSPAGDAARTVDLRLASPTGGLLLWEDGGPVSLAGWGSPTPNGIRIGPVYTPPEHRGRGYGSAVTAAVTQQSLEAGHRFCFLYTDLANPTSNKIYLDLGYEPVCDSVEYAFEA